MILNYLSHTLKVNTILELPTDLVNESIEVLKTGLIKSIREIHPRVEDIDWNKLDLFTNELKNYGNIYTTNYDLFLYHIIMKSIDESRKDKSYIAYQDYFWGDAEVGYKQFMPYQAYKYKHIYYLHGALFIFNRGIRDLKIKRGGEGVELIDIIAEEIKNGHFPLFITEGTAQDKMNSIYRSNYLYFCLQNFNCGVGTSVPTQNSVRTEVLTQLCKSQSEKIQNIFFNSKKSYSPISKSTRLFPAEL